MQVLKKALPLALALTTAVMGTTAHAKSISGSVDFRVTLPEVLVLYHWDDAHLTLTDNVADVANDSDTDREISDATTRELTAELNATSPHTITGDVTRSRIANLDKGNKVKVTLQNAWAVRALSTGDVKLEVTTPNATLKNVTDQNSTIAISNTKIKAGTVATGAGEGTSLTLPSKWTETMGDINFEMDLSGAKHTGEYNTRGVAGKASDAQEDADTFLLTLTSKLAGS